MRAKITQDTLAKMTPGKILADNEVRGFCARKLSSGSVSLGFRYRASGKERWRSFGILGGEITLDEARKQAKIEQGKVAEGSDPAAEVAAEKAAIVADAETAVSKLAATYLEHQQAKLRPKTHYETTRIFARFILPAFGKRPVGEIRRSEVVAMLDKVKRDGMSNRVLITINAFFNWHAIRSDDFRSPLPRHAKALARGKSKPRQRVLADDEIADLWAVLAEPGVVPAHLADHLRLILLTGQRPGEVGAIEAHEVEHDDAGRPFWRMPADKNKIGIEHLVPLSPMAFAIIEPRLKRHRGSFLFSRCGNVPAPDYPIAMNLLRKALAGRKRAGAGRKTVPHWTRHDLRRTARTLMSRGGRIEKDIAERVLGHMLPGMRGVYDCHDYLAEKRDALERLAAMVATITNPPSGGNVVPLRNSAAV